ncbi:MAG: phosphoenolpyruvate carboxylase [Gammaproteobacteria bacterium]|nr:MAG: phosphoenolpyruvate carboxylase [Gammaproteobacteria bacterium]
MSVLRREQVVFDAKDEALREDVRVLGTLVGELVREQGGQSLFELVESARRAAIERREVQEGAEARLVGLVDTMKPDTAREFIRAFSTYFQMVNTAERVHRIRRRRHYLNDPDVAQPGSFEHTLRALQAEGVEWDRLQNELGRMRLEPVFTAHPTEPTRRTILRKQQKIVRRMVDLLNPMLTPEERRTHLERIRLEVTTGWQTEEHPNERMSVADELEHVLFFFTDVLYRMIPPFYESLEQALVEVYGREDAAVPTFLHFASWVGGDMDGNPEVTAKTIRASLARQRALVLNLYHRECAELAQKLSQTEGRIEVNRELRERSRTYAAHFPDAAHDVPARHRDMPYRVLLRLVMARLQSTYDESSFPYEHAEEFLDDIQLIAGSLQQHRGRHAGLFAVQRLIRRIETFGFHMATLDVRQDAAVHRAVIAEGLGEPEFLELSPQARRDRLLRALAGRELPRGALSAQARKLLAVFQAIGFCRRKYGRRAIGAYIVSMTHGSEDVLAALLLARWGELARKTGAVPLDIVPLFETVEDLERGPEIMQELFSLPVYAEHLVQRGHHQMVMVGYSDSNKDGGLAAARWALQKAQQSLVDTLGDAGVELTLFHGRGGTVSRGGGKTHAAVLAAPPGAIRGRLRLTEQGEMVNQKYGLRAIAMRTLEQTWSAVLDRGLHPRSRAAEQTSWHEVMETVADASRERYKKLVYGDHRFADYFRAATPVDVIERMRIGSRPPSRKASASIEDLRAIPWVFSWSQARFELPGWFGLGSGLSAAAERHDEAVLIEMAREWYFLNALVEDVETVLARADMEIAGRYSGLASDLHGRFFPIVRQEFELTLDWVLKLTGQQRLLARDDTLRRSIRLRNPYMDPISFLQVDLLQRWRASGREDEAIFRALMASVNGIAHGLQNTG